MTRSPHDEPHQNALRRAETLLAERLAAADEGPAIDVEALCREHPELTEALQELGGSWTWLERTLDSVSEDVRAAALRNLARVRERRDGQAG